MGGPALLAAMMVVLLGAALSNAQTTQPSLDELLNINPRPGASAAPATQPAGETAVPIDPGVARKLSDEEAGDEFRAALQQMDQAAEMLRQQYEAGLPTQRLQRSVLAKLDQVIAAAQRRGSGSNAGSASGGGGPPDPTRQESGAGSPGSSGRPGVGPPGSASAAGGANPGTGGAPPGSASAKGPDGRPLQENRSEWGNLPPRLRDELLQGLGEQFSPVYKTLTEQYYRRLAEESR